MAAKPVFRDDRWIRQLDELVSAICLADYPSLSRSGCVTIEPGAAAIFYHDDGSLSLHFERCCKIPGSVTDLTIFTLDPFTLTYQHPRAQLSLELRFQGYRNGVEAFAQKLRFLLNQKSQLFKNEVQQITQEFVWNWFSDSSHDLSSPKGEMELIQYFEQFTLDVKVRNSSLNSSIITRCPDAIPAQDASIGYFIYLKGKALETAAVIPLSNGEYLIGRASTLKILEERLLYQDGRPGPKVIWFPKAPGPSTIVRVAQVVVKNNRVLIYDWPSRQSRENIKINHWGSFDGITNPRSNGHPLKGFEKLFFDGDPQIELLYIPPMIDNFTVGRDDLLDYLELNGLWASAAHGWEKEGNNEKALTDFNRALECSQKNFGSPIEQANILLSICRVMQKLHPIPDMMILNTQIEAYRLLDLPMFNVNVIGKICVQEKPLQLRVLIRNMSKQKQAKMIRIFYSCEELGIFEQLDYGELAPRRAAERSFLIESIYKAGKFPVRISMEFISQDGNPYELLLTDFLEVVKRHSRVDVDGDSGVVSVQVEDQESVPDIHIGRDAGAIFIKIKKKEQEVG